MESLQFTPREIQLAANRRLKFQGTAKVSLDDIQFSSQSQWKLDQKNIDWLCKVFREEECQNLSVAHCASHRIMTSSVGRSSESMSEVVISQR